MTIELAWISRKGAPTYHVKVGNSSWRHRFSSYGLNSDFSSKLPYLSHILSCWGRIRVMMGMAVKVGLRPSI